MVNVFLKTILACCNWPRSSAPRAYRKRRPPRPLHYQRTYVTSTATNIFQNPQLSYRRTRDRRGGHEKTCRRDDSPRALAPPTTLRDRRSVSGKSTSEAFNLGHCTRRGYMRRERIRYGLTRIPVRLRPMATIWNAISQGLFSQELVARSGSSAGRHGASRAVPRCDCGRRPCRRRGRGGACARRPEPSI